MAKSIAVAGKGGTGKSTVAALMIRELCRRGETPVLAIDADPDANLGTLLGIETVQSVGQLREDVLKEIKNFPAGMTKAGYFEAGLHQIIEEETGFDLITMGRGEGSGCYCYLNSLIRKFSESLTRSYKWIVTDNEAGLEHLSRRTTQDVDALIVVVTDNPLSLSAARRISEITESLKGRISEKYLITNMVSNGKRETLKKHLKDIPIEHLSDVPYDSEIESMIYKGESLIKLDSSPILESIKLIIDKIGGKNGSS